MDNAIIIITNEYFAGTPEELSDQLFVNYFRALLSENYLPPVIAVYGSGVKILNNEPLQELLQQCIQSGTQILYCKTCLNYYDIDFSSGLKSGVIATMTDIVQLQHKATKIIYM